MAQASSRLVRDATVITLEDSHLRASIHADPENATSFGTLAWLSRPHSEVSLVGPAAALPVWSAQFVVAGENKTFTVDATVAAEDLRRHAAKLGAVGLELQWENLRVAHVGSVNVTLTLSLADGELHHRLSFVSTCDGIGLWSWSMRPAGAVLLGPDAAVFENRGFGVVHQPPKSFGGDYPEQTLQFMAAMIAERGDDHSGIYVAAHDPLGSSKHFECEVSGAQASFAVSATPPGAGLPLSQQASEAGELGVYRLEYPVVLAVFQGGWWEAAQRYRAWALANASWTRQGPLLQRADVAPWLYNLTTWVNSHWQQNDIFNLTGGDPFVVRQRLTQIVERFGLDHGALGLHWYEWDTLGYQWGSNYSKCSSEVTCGFDTHYPEYFPAREGFGESLRDIQALGVRVAPYINGRIFDRGTDRWTRDEAVLSSAKAAAPALWARDLSLYEEEYGSEAKFAVMCPHTKYWQDTISKVVHELTASLGTDGVYIDQIAAAGPRNCWDPSHGHTLGGGHHWVAGYAAMLRTARQLVGKNKIIMTESNSEPFMGGVDLFLTLVGFSAGALPGAPGPGAQIVPAFQAVYGGYVLPAGAEFFQQDFEEPDLFAAKVAAQFTFGAQLGWFSLGGRDNQGPPMGVHELLLDRRYDPEVSYIRTLSRAKLVANRWFNHGRAMRPPDLSVNVTCVSGSTTDLSSLAFGPLMSSVWMSSDSSSLLLTMTTVMRVAGASVHTVLDLSDFGFGTQEYVSGRRYQVWRMESDGEGPDESLGTFKGDAVPIVVSMGPRSVFLIRIELADEAGGMWKRLWV